MLSQKESISTEDEIMVDTRLSKVLNALGTLLIITGLVLMFIATTRAEADILDGKQAFILSMVSIVSLLVGVWFELKSQRHKKCQTFQEYIHDDYDRLQEDNEEDYDGDYDRLQDGSEDSFNSDFPEEQARKGGTYYGNE